MSVFREIASQVYQLRYPVADVNVRDDERAKVRSLVERET